jgi:hypothetical protein
MDAQQRAHAQLVDATRIVRAYADSELSGHLVSLMDALTATYSLELMHVSTDGLVRVQSALRQVLALRDVLTNDGLNDPKI